MQPHPDPAARAISERLSAHIREAIAESGGRLPFERFMELALYAPGLGYYVTGAYKFGPGGDFITAPEVSPLFGRCLAAQCAEALERLDGGDILEFGAGSGALAAELLAELERRNALPGRYCILEPSPELRERQRARLAERLPHLIARCDWLERLPQGLRGVVIANEVLDAMPVQRFRIGEQGEIEEIFVIAHGEGFAEVSAPPQSPGLTEAVRALQAAGLACAPGYSSERNPHLAPWMRALAESLDAALVLLIDYGQPRAVYYHPERAMGTLMCHARHQAHGDPYRNPGLQDITAHVDFSAVAEAAEAAGLRLAGFTTQAHFLIGCGIDALLAEHPDALELSLGAKQLLLPTAMGEAFKVLGLERRLDGPWRGFSVRDLRDAL